MFDLSILALQANVSCVPDTAWPPYFLNSNSGTWEIWDATHKPTNLASVYKGNSAAIIGGTIVTSGDFNYTEAAISRQCYLA